MHDTHYHPIFWGVPANEEKLSDLAKIDSAMLRAKNYAIAQYDSVVSYMKSIGVDKPVHIGETGWASTYKHMREWTNSKGISCFYFEAFDEQWKDAGNPLGSENHFGLISLKSEAKFAIWDLVDAGIFKGLTRDGKPITKTHNGNADSLMRGVKAPPTAAEIKARK